MSILYNCHTDGDNYRITKFNDGEVESSYLCSESECQCPAGSRPVCRHRLMLPMFLNRGAVDTFWFLDFERKGWVSNEPAELLETRLATKPIIYEEPEGLDEGDDIEGFERSELGSYNLEPAAIVIQQYNVKSDSVSILSAEELIEATLPKPYWRRI